MKNIRFWLHWLLVTALAAALYPFPVLLRVWSNGAQWTAPVMTAALAGCAWLGMLYILLLRLADSESSRGMDSTSCNCNSASCCKSR